MTRQIHRDAPVIVSARRTPIGSIGRGFASHTVDALAAPVLAAVADAVAPAGLPIDDVILGNCLGPGGDVARVSALRAGLGLDVPGVTVDRQCGSGLDAVQQAASRVRAGDAKLVIAGGAESASTAPWRFWPPEAGSTTPTRRYERAPFAPAGMPDPEMGPAADAVAVRFGVSRERQDAWAVRSHDLATVASAAGRFDDELVSVDGIGADDRPRPNLDARTLSRFRPAFGGDGTVTAGNSCGISDGAAAMAVTSETVRAELGLPGLRIVASAITGSDPALPGMGAAGAIRRAIDRAGASVADLGFVELTEAFAAQVLAVSDAVGLDETTISGDGGAIALGHPWGASGAVLLVRLAARMHAADDARLGLAACSIGGGQGIAMIVERVA
ncbi:thiolase family protein [Agromyces neolithicus]|uniref:Thiolase family protein n=1 Tax=Agromyces neolithicus TaxID=269420 RepID=A0ABP4YNG7_9MICO